MKRKYTVILLGLLFIICIVGAYLFFLPEVPILRKLPFSQVFTSWTETTEAVPCDSGTPQNKCFWKVQVLTDYYDEIDQVQTLKQGECRMLATWYIEQRELVSKNVVVRKNC